MNNKTDIVLIKANNQRRIFQSLSDGFSGKEPPLWIILIAAYLRERGFSVSVIDAEAENLDVSETVKKALALDPTLVSSFLGMISNCLRNRLRP